MNLHSLCENPPPSRFDFSGVRNEPPYSQRKALVPVGAVSSWRVVNETSPNYVQFTTASYRFIKFTNRSFAKRVKPAGINKRTSVSTPSKKTGPPSWLLQRMEALRRLPPPTLQEVETSFRSAEEARQRYVPSRSNY